MGKGVTIAKADEAEFDSHMAARDVFHEAVKNALVKDGWTITHDPLALPFGEIDLAST